VIDMPQIFTVKETIRAIIAGRQRVLAKILLCRTPILKGRVYECPECGSRCRVDNSCTDRHGPH
jgi:hypothetical protein